MQHQGSWTQPHQVIPSAVRDAMETALSRQVVIGLFLVVALIAFEVFNFDTTQYALANLLGEVQFLGIHWATILAFAFCAIDFAGLAHLFTPQRGIEEPREVWYLMGAWLLGATMNALMTWWAINLTLLQHAFGNEVLSRDELLRVVPIFVAVLVWLTRILFIGAFSVMGDHLFGQPGQGRQAAARAARRAGAPISAAAVAPAKRPEDNLARPSAAYAAPLSLRGADRWSGPAEVAAAVAMPAAVADREPAPTVIAPTVERGAARRPAPRPPLPARPAAAPPLTPRRAPLPAGLSAAPRRRA